MSMENTCGTFAINLICQSNQQNASAIVCRPDWVLYYAPSRLAGSSSRLKLISNKTGKKSSVGVPPMSCLLVLHGPDAYAAPAV
jgi:hypothetical protein